MTTPPPIPRGQTPRWWRVLRPLESPYPPTSPIIPSAINDPAVIQAAVAQALATHPTGVYADLYYPEGALVADQMLQAGAGTNCLADYASASVGYVINAGIPAVQDCPVLGVPAPSDFAGSAPFLSAFEARFHSAP